MYKVMGTSYNSITARGEGIITILVIIMLGLAVCFDLWKSKIPNWLTGMGVMTGYAAHIRGEGEKGILLVTVMMLIPVILFYLLFLIHAMGAGDIKLFMALSCMTDYSIVLHTIIFSLCLAAVYGLFRLIRQGTLLQRILYFRNYMQSSLVRKQWVPYREQSGMKSASFRREQTSLILSPVEYRVKNISPMVSGKSGSTVKILSMMLSGTDRSWCK